MNKLSYLNKYRLFITSMVLLPIWQLSAAKVSDKYSLITIILGLYFCILVPGVIAVISLGAKKLTAQTLLFASGLSFIFIILVGIGANYVPLIFGISQTLSLTSVMVSYDVLLVLVVLWSVNVNNSFPKIDIPRLVFSSRSIVVYTLVFIGLIACILGTFRLNNGADNYLSVFGFCVLVANGLLVFFWRQRLPTHTFLITIAGISIGMFLITSLRSSYISGQDLKQEFRVYNITNTASHWSISNLRDPYNACLSITLYPYVLVKLLHVAPSTVFKIIYQIVFTTCPLIVFIALKMRTGKSLALAGVMFFLALPTLGLDLPLQARQQMAFMLFGLLIFTWFYHTEKWMLRHWHFLFVAFSFGLIVSHYSTSYIYIGTLMVYYVLRKSLSLLPYIKKRITNNSFALPGKVILLVILFSFFWLGQVTSASANLFEKLRPAFSAFISGGPSISETSDVTVIPIGGQSNPLYGYILRTKIEGAQPNRETYREVYPVNDTAKPAPILNFLPNKLKELASTISQKIYYVVGIAVYPALILIGLVSIILRSKGQRLLSNYYEYILLSTAVLSILALQIILPGITADYGITRAFIQAFIILCVPFIFGVRELINLTRYKRAAQTIAVAGAFILLLTYSGLTSELLGGIRPQLNLNNSGPYYGAFYVRRNDIEAYRWIEQNISSPGNVSSPDYSFPTALAYFPKYRHYGGSIFPFQENKGNFTLLNYTQTQDNLTYTTGSVLAVPFSTRNYNKDNIIYTNSYSRVYK